MGGNSKIFPSRWRPRPFGAARFIICRCAINMSDIYSIYRLVWAALLAALIGAGAFISIPTPFSPVPVTLQDMFLVLAGFLLGWRYGLIALGLYMFAGALGLPVFSGGKGGVGVILGPTGGYFLGFVLVVLGAAWCRRFRAPLAGLVCLAAIFAMLFAGSVRLGMFMDIPLSQALVVGFIPFVPGSVLKVAAALGIYKFMLKNRLVPHDKGAKP